MNQLQFLGALEIGLIYGLVALGVYLTFRIIDFPDLTVDGSFTLGAAVSAIMISLDYNPWLATSMAIVAGGLAGSITGYLNVRWNILGLLAGILTMTALYSINLRVMSKPNIALINKATIFNFNPIITSTSIIIILVILLLARFFASEFGLSVRAIGINPKVSTAYGINVGKLKVITLALSNAIVALGGSLFTQSQGFADISMGNGTVIVGLASVIIGESIIHPKKVMAWLVACIVGSILYRIVIAFALNANDIGLEASDLNLITAMIVAFTMILPKLKKA